MTRTNRQPHPRDALSYRLRDGFIEAEEMVLDSFRALQERYRAERDALQGKAGSHVRGRSPLLKFFMPLDFKLELSASRVAVRWISIQKRKDAARIEAGNPKTWVSTTLRASSTADLEDKLKLALSALHPNVTRDEEQQAKHRRQAGIKGRNSGRVYTHLTEEEHAQLETLVLETQRSAERLLAVWATLKSERRSVERVYTVATRALDLLPQRAAPEF